MMNSKEKKPTVPANKKSPGKKAPSKKAPPKKAPAKKQKEKGLGAKLVGKPDHLVSQWLTDKKAAKWAIDQLTNEGPGHKQVQNAMLLKQVSAFVAALEKSSGMPFKLQEGQKIASEHHGDKKVIPVHLTQATLQAFKNKAVVDAFSKGPEHELLMYGLLLQVFEWASLAIKRK